MIVYEESVFKDSVQGRRSVRREENLQSKEIFDLGRIEAHGIKTARTLGRYGVLSRGFRRYEIESRRRAFVRVYKNRMVS